MAPKPVLVPKKKRTLLPLLTVLFMASYGLMTLLIVEQGSTIQSQRNLIQVLLGDSRQLWALKGKALSDRTGRGRTGPSPKPGKEIFHPDPVARANSVYPDSIKHNSVNPDPVNPGTTAPFSKPCRQECKTLHPGSTHARFRFRRSAPRIDYALAQVLRIVCNTRVFRLQRNSRTSAGDSP